MEFGIKLLSNRLLGLVVVSHLGLLSSLLKNDPHDRKEYMSDT
jgi:hypothetical protein